MNALKIREQTYFNPKSSYLTEMVKALQSFVIKKACTKQSFVSFLKKASLSSLPLPLPLPLRGFFPKTKLEASNEPIRDIA
jgi:hypothetical protein